MEAVIATHNKNKVAEMEGVLREMLGTGHIYTPSELGITDDIEENGISFEENAMLKARYLWREGWLSIADDSGLCVKALGGAPGIYSARFAGEPSDSVKNNEKLLSSIKNAEDRTAKFVCVIACKLPSGEEFTVRGEAVGEILTEAHGSGGFGYDPLFYFPPLNKTFAELTPDEKHSVSHRGNALRRLQAELGKKLKMD